MFIIIIKYYVCYSYDTIITIIIAILVNAQNLSWFLFQCKLA